MSVCTLQPHDGEVYSLPLFRNHATDLSIWMVNGGNEECICFTRMNDEGRNFLDKYKSLPRWRWEQMVKGGHTKLLKFALP